ncbi:outer membrane protein [Aquipluma nitroreducens]|uniref:Outer membrane protein n=1 Tax=Aquipluma nitroreducens TaxID=2010828 RepID=A0A5K7S9N4_9BACT|nr:OmpA family protein [Aquipluma nitroreducens]BBE18215.1 outer membrane protein [Aquipluma nitroreducens]
MKTLKFFLILIFCLGSINIDAQINIKDKLKRQTNNRTNKNVDQGINKGLDKVENGVKDLFKKKNKDNQDSAAVDQPLAGNQDSKQSLKAFSNYDFVPGDKVLLYEDFSQDAVGDFPALWTTNKSGEVNTLNVAPGNWLNLNATEGNWWFLKQIEFPKNFIVEFDVVPKKGAPRYAVGVTIYGENGFKEMSDPYASKTGLIINIAKSGWESHGIKAGSPRISGDSNLKPVEEEKLNHVIIWVQNRRVRIYHKGEKVLDMPTNLYDDSKFTRFGFMLYRGASSASYVSNIKITTASPDTRNKLLTEGKLVTYGIYFDVNKDVVKPESYGTLNDIAKILNEVPEVKVKILGHTDSDGQDAANLDLSKRRAASVKAELARTFGVNADRLITDGMGETQPVAPNDTPSNKALNRRVEFIKQ